MTEDKEQRRKTGDIRTGDKAQRRETVDLCRMLDRDRRGQICVTGGSEEKL